MELRHLRYFVAVAEERHVTRAAARLGIQQPPLSQQIRALEAELELQLFRRKPRGVELTPAGEAFLAEARIVLERAEHAVLAARRVARGEAGRLGLGFTSSASFHPLVPRVIRDFRETSPPVRVSRGAGRMLATLGLVGAGLGVPLTPASMRRVGIDGVAYRAIERKAGLVAPLNLACRRGEMAPAACRFIALARQIAAQLPTPSA